MAHLEVQGRAPSTLVRYRSAIRVNIVPALGHVVVVKLTAADLDAFYASLLRRGLKPLSVRKCHAVLSAALRQAVKWGWIDRNPIDRAPPSSTRSADVIPPTVEVLRRRRARATERAELAGVPRCPGGVHQFPGSDTAGTRRDPTSSSYGRPRPSTTGTVVILKGASGSAAGLKIPWGPMRGTR